MIEARRTHAIDETATRAEGAWLAQRLQSGNVVLLEGKLGAGKTTFVRGLLESLGYDHAVRSPSFGLIQTFDTNPPIAHCDLYRLKSHQGLGLEDYMTTHALLIEWPDRAEGLVPDAEAWHVRIEFSDDGREIQIVPPAN